MSKTVSIAVALIFAAPALSDAGTIRAFVAGNSRYSSPRLEPLPLVRQEVEDLARRLVEAGVAVVYGKPLLDQSLSDFNSAFEGFVRSLSADDVAFVYYSGHGVQVGGESYLLPVSAELEEPQDVVGEAIDFNAMLRSLAARGTRANIVFIDACRNDPFGTRPGLAKPAGIPNTFVLYAASPGFAAQADSGFGPAVSEELPTPGLPIQNVAAAVRSTVLAKTNGAQLPTEFSTLNAQAAFIPAVIVKVAIEDADDDVKILLNGSLISAHRTHGTNDVSVPLQAGPNAFTIRVFNQRSFTGGIEGFGGHLPEGWRYAVRITGQDGSIVLRLADGEDRPQKDGTRHGHEFEAGSFVLNLAKRDRLVSVISSRNRVW